MRKRTSSTIDPRAAVGAMGVLAAVLALAGCNIVAPIALVLEGPPKKEKVTELDGSRPTVVLVDDRNSVLPRRSLRAMIGKTAEQDMLSKKVVQPGNMIAALSAQRVAGDDSYSDPLSVVEIGRRVGAEVVVYVEMQYWTLSRDGGVSPAAQANVKIVDTVTNQRLWPANPEGYPLMAQMPRQAEEMTVERSRRAAIEESLAAYFGREVSRLFYTYERETASSQRR